MFDKIQKIKTFFRKPGVKKQEPVSAPSDYFSLARSWADDFYVSVEASRNRWRAITLCVFAPMVLLLLSCVLVLVPLQHWVPLVIHHYANGLTAVTPLKQAYAPKDKAQVEADIIRYVRYRESYSSETYDFSYRLIHLISSKSVALSYDREQSAANKNAPITILGNKGYQTVKVENIVFLDNESQNQTHSRSRYHRNLAQVDFLLVTHNKQTGRRTSLPLTAVLSWRYRGIPSDPGDRWLDWNGFRVTSYQVHKRNI